MFVMRLLGLEEDCTVASWEVEFGPFCKMNK